MKHFNIAVVGATGLVGRKMLEILEEEKISIKNLFLFASARSDGKKLQFGEKSFEVEQLTENNVKLKKIDYALFSAGSEISKIYAPIFASQGAVVIDNSSFWRNDDDVPLVVPEVNPQDAFNHKNIIANPNCSTIQAVVALAPLHKVYGIERVIYSTYQSVSGAGKSGIDDLIEGEKGFPPKKFIKPIFRNLIPHIDVFLPNNYTKEEMKMVSETRKILGDKNLKITATCVRVPVLFGHSESINVTFKKPFLLSDVKNILNKAKGIVVIDDPSKNEYPFPLMCQNTNEVYVGRLRIDESANNSLNMWVVADNIRKGAATNAVQILKLLIQANN